MNLRTFLYEKKEYREEIKKCIDDSDKMIQSYFVFDDLWDMERFDHYEYNEKLSWNHQVFSDSEWAYMFTRMGFLYKFIVAYENTLDYSYLNHGLTIIKKWLKDNLAYCTAYRRLLRVVKPRNLATRTLDLSIFLVNMVDYITYCDEMKVIDQRDDQNLKSAVEVIIKYIMRFDDLFRSYSNWGIIEICNLIYVVKLLELRNHDIQQLYDRLNARLCNQINEDGSHIESSPFYLVEILLALFKIVPIIDNKEKDYIVPICKKITSYIAWTRTVEDKLYNLGDSDLIRISDVLVLSYDRIGITSHLVHKGEKCCLEFVYRYGIDIRKCKRDGCKNEEWRDSRIIELKDQTILNTKKGEKIICSNSPPVSSGHKHYDYMSVYLALFGESILIDSGRYTYKDCKEREYLVGPEAHNTIRINGTEFYKYINAWESVQRISCNKNVITKGENCISVIMSCLFGEQVEVKRVVSYIEEEGVIITDIVITQSSKVLYEAFFNLSHRLHYSFIGERVCFTNKESNRLYYHNSITDYEIREGLCSDRYNEKHAIKQVYIKSTVARVINHYFLFRNTNVDAIHKSADKGFDYHIGQKRFFVQYET